MTKEQRAKKVGQLMMTSVDDCRITLQGHHDATLLCDLLIMCSQLAGHKSREQVVRRRIAALIPKKRSSN